MSRSPWNFGVSLGVRISRASSSVRDGGCGCNCLGECFGEGGELGVAFDAAVLAFRGDEPGGGPSQAHVPVTPPFHVPGAGAHDVDGDSIGFVVASVFARVPVTPSRMIVTVSSRPSRSDPAGVRVDPVELAGELLELRFGLHRRRVLPRRSQVTPHSPVLTVR